MTYYRVRQVAAMFFALECQDDKSASYPIGGDYWRLLENGYGWDYAETTAYLYRCEIV